MSSSLKDELSILAAIVGSHGPATCVPSTPMPSLALPTWLLEDHSNSGATGEGNRKRCSLTILSLSSRLWSYFLPMLLRSLKPSVILLMLNFEQNVTEQCSTKVKDNKIWRKSGFMCWDLATQWGWLHNANPKYWQCDLGLSTPTPVSLWVATWAMQYTSSGYLILSWRQKI